MPPGHEIGKRVAVRSGAEVGKEGGSRVAVREVAGEK